MLSTINKVLFYLVALFIIFPYKVSAQHQDSILISLLTCYSYNFSDYIGLVKNDNLR